MPEHLFVVEDEPDIAALLERTFRREGWTVTVCANGREAVERLLAGAPPSLLLVDVNLPEVSGFEICRRVRREPALADLPVVVVSARSDEIDRVVGFEVGADDYVTKPFSVRELVLRIRALLRRTRDLPTSRAPEGGRIVFGALTLEPEAHRAWVAEEEILLTPIEYRLVLSFLQHRGRALSREDILSQAWGEDLHITSRTVDTHVKRLRAKLGVAGEALQTLRGVGYRWAAAPAER